MKFLLASEFERSFSNKIRPIIEEQAAGKKAVFIPTASNGDDWKPDPENNIHVFGKMGMEVSIVDIEGMGEQEAYSALKGASVISVGGGNSFYLLEHMNKCNFKEIILKDEFKDAFYIGSSAGSIVMSPDIKFIRQMDDASRANLRDYTGLGVIDFMFLPHMDNPYMGRAAHKIAKAYKNANIRALYDDQLVYVDGPTMRFL